MSADAARNWILTARRQAEIARAIYLGESFVRALAELSGAIGVRMFQANHIQAAALIYDSHVHLVVCGSNDEYDWFANSNSRIRYVAKEKVIEGHKGFVDSANWLCREILGTGFRPALNGKKMYLGGHSAGGAIAEILPLFDDRLSPSEVYTFGAPKWCVTDSVPVYLAQGWKTHRFVMSYDPVPYLPLTLWRMLFMQRYFAHTSSGIEVAETGELRMCNRVSQAKRLAVMSRAALGIAGRGVFTYAKAAVLGAFKHVPLVPAHDSARYFEAINQSAVRGAGYLEGE
jgi:hypothetical protein